MSTPLTEFPILDFQYSHSDDSFIYFST